MAKQRVSLAPLMGVNSRRVADRTLQGTYMRGGYNVELRDGEWWTRIGEQPLSSTYTIRLGSTPWWWVLPVNRDLTIIANPWWALAVSTLLGQPVGVNELYSAAVTENVSFTNGSPTATSATTRVADQMILVGSGATSEVYRVLSRSGTTVTLERAYEGATGTKSCRFIDPLARNVAGTATAYSTTFTDTANAWLMRGSCVLFEQLVSHTATDLYAASPTLTGGNLHLVITSNLGVPVAIDVSAYLAGSTVGVRRTWFYNTALGSSATQVGTDTVSDNTYARGVYAEVYKGRLFIGAATDPNGKYGTRTLWYSQPGDLGRWHTGIAAQTAAPNFITFDGENDAIADLRILQDNLIVHRQDSQEIASVTGSSVQPFTFRSNNQGIGIRSFHQNNRVVSANGIHFIWTPNGPAVFDGRSVTQICEDAREALYAHRFIGVGLNVAFGLHDSERQRICWFWGQPNGGSASIRHQDALPAYAGVVLRSGETVSNYLPCFVYDYANNAFWFEDRPTVLGGGSFSTSGGTSPIVSRPDGTLIAMWKSGSTGTDPDMYAPETSGSNVAVYAQVETQWMDFGNLSRKQLTEVELAVRSPDVGGGSLEDSITLTGTPWIRMRVYGDRNRYTAQADVGDTYSLSGPQITTEEDYGQSAQGLLTLSANSFGRQFRLVFSNALTSAATTAGYAQLPFRISDIECEFVQQESTTPRRTLTAASISE